MAYYIFNVYGGSVSETIVSGPLTHAELIEKQWVHRDALDAGIYEVVEVSRDGERSITRALDVERELATTLRTGLSRKVRGVK